VKKPAAPRRIEAARRPRREAAPVDGLARTDLELPDGRYLLSYARARAGHDA
jgi:hypothetical protein